MEPVLVVFGIADYFPLGAVWEPDSGCCGGFGTWRQVDVEVVDCA